MPKLDNTEKMWALCRKFDWGDSLLGKYCVPGAREEDLNPKLFRTRQQARDARKVCSYKDARPVKVLVTIKIERR